MRYVAPVNAPEEVPALVNAGAAELYCGFLDTWWAERYGDHDSASRRQGRANFATLDELERCAQGAATQGVPLYLALNARYTEPQLDRLVWLCGRFRDMGGTGVIASDLGLLWRLRDYPGLERRLSILAVAQNAPTLEAFRSLGVTHAVLPRFVRPEEAGELVSAVRGMQAEVMAFFDKCPWVDGYCRHRHGVSYTGRVDCGGAGRDVGGWSDGCDENGSAPTSPLYTFDTTYVAHACMGGGRSYPQPYPCAACHLPLFEKAGVGFAKLGGRGRPLEERLRALCFLCKASEFASDEERAALYRSTFGMECACYYGDAVQDRSSIQPVEAVGYPLSAVALAAGDKPIRHEYRMHLGSQTDPVAFWQAIEGLFVDRANGGRAAFSASTAIFVPPLSEKDLERFRSLLPELCARTPEPARIVVNDYGTLVTVARAAEEHGLAVELSIGTLLARIDDPREVAHFLSADENPPRSIWGPDGEPRTLTYRKPPAELVEHWRRPSALEPSAMAALHELLK